MTGAPGHTLTDPESHFAWLATLNLSVAACCRSPPASGLHRFPVGPDTRTAATRSMLTGTAAVQEQRPRIGSHDRAAARFSLHQ